MGRKNELKSRNEWERIASDAYVALRRHYGPVRGKEKKMSRWVQTAGVAEARSLKTEESGAFAERNWAVNAFKRHLDAPSFSRWGDGVWGGSNLESLFLWHCTIICPHHGEPIGDGVEKVLCWRWAVQVSKASPNSFGMLGFWAWGFSLFANITVSSAYHA